MKSPILPFLLLALVGTLASAQTPIDQTRAVDADARIDVANIKGSISITGWDQPQVTISGTLGRGSKGLSVEGDARHLRIKVEAPERGWFNWGSDTSMGDTTLVLKVPRGATLDIDSVSADVELTGVAGSALTLATVSGKLRVDSSAARVDIDSVSGDVDFTGPAGKAEFETVSGSIRVRGLGGEIDLETVSGDIDADIGSYRRLDAQTVSGDINVRGTPANDGDIQLESMSGDLQLQLPEAIPARLKASTFSGRIRSDFSAGSGDTNAKRLDATLGAGSAQVRLETFSGDIEIRKH